MSSRHRAIVHTGVCLHAGVGRRAVKTCTVAFESRLEFVAYPHSVGARFLHGSIVAERTAAGDYKVLLVR